MPLRDLAFAPLSVAYGAAGGARRALYRAGVLRVERVGVPVLSVGNITAGGTGKTPLVEWLAREAARAGRRVCILTRGYGRADEGKRVVVSDGERVLAEAREGGDEPRLLAESLRGLAAVVSDADRVAAARWAIENLRSDVFILDDGFQHLRIARDLNILTLDATDPWGGERLLPRGRLREPIGGLKRADLIVVTRAELCDGDIEDLRARAAGLSNGRPVLVARTVTLRIAPLVAETAGASRGTRETNDITQSSPANTPQPLAADIPQLLSDDIPQSFAADIPQPFAAFCAIGNPQAFFAHARRAGLALSHTRSFADHHVYTQGDVDEMLREAARQGARSLLTTTKDAVKLRALKFTALPCYVLEVALKFDDEERMRAILGEVIARG